MSTFRPWAPVNVGGRIPGLQSTGQLGEKFAIGMLVQSIYDPGVRGKITKIQNDSAWIEGHRGPINLGALKSISDG